METKITEIADGIYRLCAHTMEIDIFKYSSLNPAMGATIRRLADLAPRTLALMHGPTFTGDGGGALQALADDYDRRVSG